MRRILTVLAALVLTVAAGTTHPRAETVPASRAAISLSFAPVVREAAPAVVNIIARRVVEERFSPFAADPFFGQMFRDFARTTPRVQNSLGSGVIVSRDGLVVSNYHVVGMASEITVVLNDRREFAAEVILAVEDSDLAVLRLKQARDLPALEFRDSDGLEVGELVLAIGNPFGIGQTVSMGIVSGLARSALSVGDGRGYFIQTDAAINPGNSGGALIDNAGRLVGINTAILTQSGGSNGVGFAIPANLVRAVVDQAASGERLFRRPWAGAAGQGVDAALAESLGLERPDGVVLVELHPESPFRAAGLLPGDVVLALDGAPVNSPQEMLFRLSARGVGGSVAVRFLRDGRAREASVALTAAPDRPPRDARVIGGNGPLAGLAVARINPAVTEEFDLPYVVDGGVAVTAVRDNAARVGLMPGDVLIAINGRPVETTAAAEAAAAQRTRNWAIDVLRGGERLRLRFLF
jgi:Do/DeqQ family serine protease